MESVSRANHDGNRVLAALPSALAQQLRPMLTRIQLNRRDPVWEPDEKIDYVYFPLDCVASILALDGNGQSVEVGTVGNEGFVGLPVFLGADSSPGRSFTQVAGEAERMSSEDFRREALRDGPLREVLHRYTQAFLTQVAQGTACNRLHATDQRLARWLLSVQDRVGGKAFSLTHEFMAQMLGVRRATVTETAQALQQAGVITYQRGELTVADRAGLERLSCDCYRIVRDEFDRLLGTPAG